MKLKTELLARLLDDDSIEHRKSRFSKEEALFVGKREIAHFHSNNEIDVRLTRPEIRRRELRKSSDPRIHFTSPGSDWIVVTFRRESDLPFVLELLEAADRANIAAT